MRAKQNAAFCANCGEFAEDDDLAAVIGISPRQVSMGSPQDWPPQQHCRDPRTLPGGAAELEYCER
jgi:hypothetical protein